MVLSHTPQPSTLYKHNTLYHITAWVLLSTAVMCTYIQKYQYHTYNIQTNTYMYHNYNYEELGMHGTSWIMSCIY